MTTFRYSLVSDLHVDHPQPKTPPMEQTVIVAGDTGNGLVGLKMLQKLKRKGHTVFAVDGNHEHYANDAQGRSIEQTEEAFFKGLDQQRILDLIEGELTVVGVNGWYLVPNEDEWLGYMNDGRFAGRAADVNRIAVRHMEWLDDTLSLIQNKVIVVTHTAPTMLSLDPRFEGHPSNVWYWNPLMQPLLTKHADKIAVWHHGHTHRAMDVTAFGVRIVTNPRGYPRENPSWKPLTMEIEV